MTTSTGTLPTDDGNPYQSPQPLKPDDADIAGAKTPLYQSIPTRYEAAPRHLLKIIVAGLICWGLVHSIGSWLGGEENVGLKKNIVRGAIVFTCVGFFLLIWRLLLVSRKPRRAKYRIRVEEPDETAK